MEYRTRSLGPLGDRLLMHERLCPTFRLPLFAPSIFGASKGSDGESQGGSGRTEGWTWKALYMCASIYASYCVWSLFPQKVAKTTAIMGAFGYFCYVYGTVVGSDSADSWQVAPAMALYQRARQQGDAKAAEKYLLWAKGVQKEKLQKVAESNAKLAYEHGSLLVEHHPMSSRLAEERCLESLAIMRGVGCSDNVYGLLCVPPELADLYVFVNTRLADLYLACYKVDLAEERYQWCISLKLGSGAQRGAAQWSLVLAYCAKEDAGKAIEICEKWVASARKHFKKAADAADAQAARRAAGKKPDKDAIAWARAERSEAGVELAMGLTAWAFVSLECKNDIQAAVTAAKEAVQIATEIDSASIVLALWVLHDAQSRSPNPEDASEAQRMKALAEEMAAKWNISGGQRPSTVLWLLRDGMRRAQQVRLWEEYAEQRAREWRQPRSSLLINADEMVAGGRP